MSLTKNDINNTLKQESVKSRVRRNDKKQIRFVEVTGVDEQGFEYTQIKKSKSMLRIITNQ